LTEAAAGDLVFFSHPGEEPHHVGFFAGAGRMLHSPGTGHGVEEIELASSRYAVELLPEGRRYSAP
jgi:cell wall-associated NlpC family hydrolase